MEDNEVRQKINSDDNNGKTVARIQKPNSAFNKKHAKQFTSVEKLEKMLQK